MDGPSHCNFPPHAARSELVVVVRLVLMRIDPVTNQAPLAWRGYAIPVEQLRQPIGGQLGLGLGVHRLILPSRDSTSSPHPDNQPDHPPDTAHLGFLSIRTTPAATKDTHAKVGSVIKRLLWCRRASPPREIAIRSGRRAAGSLSPLLHPSPVRPSVTPPHTQ